MKELDRIQEVYQARNKNARKSFFGFEDLAHLYRIFGRYKETLLLLNKVGYENLSGLRILDIGCGDGRWLRQAIDWGGDPNLLAGVELLADQVEIAKRNNPLVDIREGSAHELPWDDDTFDIICQHTVFSSILDDELRNQVIAEIMRVLRPDGLILWYDFWLNPTNPQTKGIRKAEIKELFFGSSFIFRKITLAPPLARKIVPVSWVFSSILEKLKIFNTHYLVLIRPEITKDKKL